MQTLTEPGEPTCNSRAIQALVPQYGARPAMAISHSERTSLLSKAVGRRAREPIYTAQQIGPRSSQNQAAVISHPRICMHPPPHAQTGSEQVLLKRLRSSSSVEDIAATPPPRIINLNLAGVPKQRLVVAGLLVKNNNVLNAPNLLHVGPENDSGVTLKYATDIFR